MANVMISFPGDPAVIFFSFVPIRLRISFSLFLLLPAILHGTLAKHNSIFHKVFPIFLVGYYFLFPKRSQSVSENHFRNQEESTDCIVMHRRQRYERGKKRFSLVFHYRV